jgi:hypothetical protein
MWNEKTITKIKTVIDNLIFKYYYHYELSMIDDTFFNYLINTYINLSVHIVYIICN